MPRWSHFIAPAGSDAQPGRLVALDCDSQALYDPARPDWRTGRMTQWAAAGWEVDRRGAPRWHEKEGLTADQLWSAVDWSARRPGRTWIVSWCAARVWGLIGLWGLIESGRVRLVGEDHRGRVDCAARGQVPVVQPGPTGPGDGGGRTGPGYLPGVRCHVRPGLPGHRTAGRRDPASAGYAVLEDPPSVVQCRLAGRPGTLVLVDARNWGLEGWPDRACCLERARWTAGCMRRMIDLLTLHGWGALQVTAGSQAAYTWRRRYYTDAVHCHADPEALTLERRAYIGGRCEALTVGPLKGPLYHVDFRSLYPACCAETLLPSMLVGTADGSLASYRQALGSGAGCLAEVVVESAEPAYPRPGRPHASYSVGRWWTVLAGPELADAVGQGRVVAWGRCAYYRLSPCLRAFVEGLWPVLCGLRATGDGPIVAWLKRLLVSLPGKLGQRGWRWQAATGLDPPGPWVQWWRRLEPGVLVRCRSLGWQQQMEIREDWAPHAVPAVAAWVTSAARCRLLEALRTAGWDQTHYMDTDSLVVSARGFQALQTAGLIADDELGKLRLLGVHATGHVWGPKHYQLDDELKCSGLPRGTATDAGDGVHYWYRDWLRRAVSQGRRPEAAETLRRYAAGQGKLGPRADATGRVRPVEVWE